MDKLALWVKAFLIYFTFQVSSIQTWLFSDGSFTCTLQIVKVRCPLFYFRLFREIFFLLFLASTNKAGSCIEEMFDMFHSCLLQLCSCTVKLVESRGLFCFSVSHLCPFYWTYWCVFILYMKWTCRYSVVWSIAGDMTQVYTSKASLVFWCCMTDLPCLKTTILSIKFLFWNKSHAENDHVCNLHVASWVIGETQKV